MPKVLIGCRLPHGLTISHPNPDIKATVTLKGIHTARPLVVPYVTTEVDQELWDAWKLAYHDYAPLRNGAIFEARSEQDALAKSKDYKKEKTGFEPINGESYGVKPATKEK